MLRVARITVLGLTALLGLMLVLLVLVVALANTQTGRGWIERLTAYFSHQQVQLQGLSGRFPDRLALAQLRLSDPDGQWLQAEQLQLEWSPLQLFARHASVQTLTVARLVMPRRPNYPPKPPQGPSIFSHFLTLMRVDRLEAERVELGAALAGSDVVVRLQGQALIHSWQQMQLQLDAHRLDGIASNYHVQTQFDASQLLAQINIEEGADGPLSHLAQLPGLGALAIHLDASGPRTAVAVKLDAKAGTLTAAANGTLDLPQRTALLEMSLDSGAMQPRAGLSWQRAQLRGQWRGALSSPATVAHLEIDGIAYDALGASALRADLRGQGAQLVADATLTGLMLPSPALAVLRDAPVVLHAQSTVSDPGWPVDVTLNHPLLQGSGRWHAGAAPEATAAITMPNIKPLAALIGLPLQGRGTVQADLTGSGHSRDLAVSSQLDIIGGGSELASVLAPRADLSAQLTLAIGSVEFKRAELKAGHAQASVRGQLLGQTDLSWSLALPDLAALSPALAGRLSADGSLKGSAPRLDLSANADATLSAHGSPPGSLRLQLAAHDLPRQPQGRIDLSGALDGAPVLLNVALNRAANGSVAARIEHADWKSAHASGGFRINTDGTAPSGHVDVRMLQLGDVNRLLGASLQGSFSASADFDRLAGHDRMRLNVDASQVGVPAQQLQSLNVRGELTDLLAQPSLALQLSAEANVRGVDATLHADANGPLARLNLQLNARSAGDDEQAATASATALLSTTQRSLRLTRLQAQYRGQSALLLAPATLSWADGLQVDGLRLGSAKTELSLSGRVSPTLDVHASVHDFSPTLLKPWWPELEAQGSADLDAQLQGSLANPSGSVKLTASGLRASSGDARGLPATDIDASAQLSGTQAQLLLTLKAGSGAQLQVSGQAPLARDAAMALKLNGTFNLALINPILEAGGQRLLGQAQIDGELDGTPAAPQAQGTLSVAHGDLQDYARGVHLSDISASVTADGNQVQLKQLSARAGAGTLTATGTVGLGNDALPLDLTVTARDAQPLASDLLTATVNADLKFTGNLRQQIDAAGTIHVVHAEINIPNALPPDIEVLNVTRPGRKAVTGPKPSALVVALNLTISAPRQVFVRGRGLDAEVGGDLHIRGTHLDPDFDGGFDLRNGTINLAGATLPFNSGRVSFNGNGIRKKIDPTLDFTATKYSSAYESETLNVGGYTDAPVITLTSTPEMPQDEVLARLIFGVPVTQLTALQIAQIGAALVTMSGVGGGGFNPINAVQRRLRLDRLAISGGSSGTASGATAGESSGGATIEAGRYVSSRVYVGAKQNTNGPTQGQVQVDLTKRLKVQATVGTGGGSVQGATPQNDPGSSVGLSYQFEYN